MVCSKQNIFILLDSLQTGGAEKSLLEILSTFKRYKPVVVVLFTGGGDLDKAYAQAGISLVSLNLHQTASEKKILFNLDRIVRQIKPVLIHSTLFKSDMASRKVGHSLSIPVINSIVNNSYSWRRYGIEPWLIKLKLLVVQFLDFLSSKKVDLFIANSKTIAHAYRFGLGIPSSKIRVVQRGRDLKIFEMISLDVIYSFRSHYAPRGQKIWLNVSRLIPRKGQKSLIQAFSIMVKSDPNHVLLIAGDGPLQHDLLKEIEKFGLQSNVHLLGNSSDVPLLLKASDFFVFPSLYEGLPGVIIEAMLAKIPILASAIPENFECVDNSMALFFKSNDPEDLFDSMVKALNQKDWDLRVESAYQHAKVHFDLATIAEKYESLYDEVILKYNSKGQSVG